MTEKHVEQQTGKPTKSCIFTEYAIPLIAALNEASLLVEELLQAVLLQAWTLPGVLPLAAGQLSSVHGPVQAVGLYFAHVWPITMPPQHCLSRMINEYKCFYVHQTPPVCVALESQIISPHDSISFDHV